MATDKQIDRVLLGAFVYNGGYRAFHLNEYDSGTYPIQINTWDAVFDASLEHVGQATTLALNGFERANPSGFRADVSLLLNNSFPAEALKIRQLLDRCANETDRTVLRTNVSGVSGSTLTFDSGVAIADYYNRLVAINESNTAQQAVVTAYTVGKVATLSQSIGVSDTDSILVVAKPNLPTVIGVSENVSNTSDLIFCNLITGLFGIRRELTIGLQSINMELREINRTPFISDRYRIG